MTKLIIEKKLLKEVVGGLVWYSPTEDEQRHFGSGGVAIIDQWIASHAKYFIGEYNTWLYEISFEPKVYPKIGSHNYYSVVT